MNPSISPRRARLRRTLCTLPLAGVLLLAAAASASAPPSTAASNAPAMNSSAAASADGSSIAATRLSTEQVKLGDPFTDEVVIHGAGQGRWHANDLGADSPFTLLGQSEQDGAGEAVLKLRLGLYALGEHALPEITLVSASGAKLVVPGEAKVSATPTLAKGDEQLRGLAGPQVPLVLDRLRVALAAAAALAALLLSALLVRFAMKKIREGRSQEKRDQRTLEALLRSRCSDLEFYLVLDGIVRRHLERRHGIPAPERTAAELAALLERAEAVPKEELNRLFGEANLVKFAERPARPGQREADGLLAARLLVEKPPKKVAKRLEPGDRSHAAPQLS